MSYKLDFDNYFVYPSVVISGGRWFGAFSFPQCQNQAGDDLRWPTDCCGKLMDSLEIELTWSVKSPLAPLFPPGQRPYGPAAKEG